MLYKRKIIENKLKLNENIVNVKNIVKIIFSLEQGIEREKVPNSIFKTILISRHIIFLHKIILVQPLSEAPKILMINNDIKENIVVKRISVVIAVKTPK